jgi:hypothetical protein
MVYGLLSIGKAMVRIYLEEEEKETERNGGTGKIDFCRRLLPPGPIDFEAKVSKPRRRWKADLFEASFSCVLIRFSFLSLLYLVPIIA